MKKSIALSIAVLAASTTFALAENEPGNRAQPAGAEQRQQDPAEQQQHYIRHASSDNQLEIQLGQLAQERSQDPQVKQLGQRLAQDHQQAQQQLQQVAQAAGAQVSDQLNPVDQAKLQEMQKKQGQDFDRAFVFCQVGDHESAILMNRWEAQHAPNAQVKEYAQAQVPVLEHHLRMARETADQWVPEARTAGERMRGDRDNPGAVRSGDGRHEGDTTGNGNQPGSTRSDGTRANEANPAGTNK